MPSEVQFRPRSMRVRPALGNMLVQSTCCAFAKVGAPATFCIRQRGTWAALLVQVSGANFVSATADPSNFAIVPNCFLGKTLGI